MSHGHELRGWQDHSKRIWTFIASSWFFPFRLLSAAAVKSSAIDFVLETWAAHSHHCNPKIRQTEISQSTIIVAKKKFRRQQQSSLSRRLCNEDKWATKTTIRTWSFISYCSKEPSLCCLHICLCFLILKIIVLWSRKLILGVNHTKYDHITLVLHCSSTLTTPITSSDFFCISTQRWVCCTIATQTLNGLSHSKPTHLATPFW